MKLVYRTANQLTATGFACLLATCVTVGEPDRTPFPAAQAIDGADASNPNDDPVIAPYRDPSAAKAHPTEKAAVDWSRVLKLKPRIRFQILHTGQVKVPRSGMLNLEHEKLKGQADSEIFVDVFAYHFCHATRGCWLIDSGLDE
ncbi:MAG: hypothetical protein RIF32_22960, partial [Leptospirales bacterium]